jgi:hypothetical protein
MQFWNLPDNKYMAFIPRTGSTSWAQGIIDNFYPDVKAKQDHAARSKGSSKHDGVQFLLPYTNKPPKDAVIVGVIRNPIDRFLSGFSRAFQGESVDQAIAKIEENSKGNYNNWGRNKNTAINYSKINMHISSVSHEFKEYKDQIKWFCYETQLEDLAAFIGLDAVPKRLNQSKPNSKPVLTDEQIAKLNEIYSDDIKLYNSVKI